MSLDIESVMGAGGTLEDLIDGYQPRQSQIEMAEEVQHIIDTQETLLAEAGTGTGKTFAYLVPAILSGQKVIVSTATKTLQEQLIKEDLPMLFKACQKKFNAKLLKGRDNYVCPQRLDMAETVEQHSKEEWKKLGIIREWVDTKTKRGDRSEMTKIAEDDPIWRKCSARLEFCSSVECSSENGCFYPNVKQAAMEAEVLVVNHHLFCADLALRENGFGELLPEADIYIFDEAHQLPDIAAQFLGFSVSRGQLDELCRDIKQAQAAEAPEAMELVQHARTLEMKVGELTQAFGKWEKRWTWQQLEPEKAITQLLKRVIQQVEVIEETLKIHAERGKQLSSTHKRTKDFKKQLETWLKSDSEYQVKWAESSMGRFKLNITPLSVATPFWRQRELIGGSWIFTSATISVNRNFDYFAKRLGLEDAKSVIWPSPFNYPKQGLIYHPVGLPDPRSQDYIKICLRAAWPLLNTSNGCAFMLFTSHRAMQEAKTILEEHWPGTLLVQGTAPKLDLLDKFRVSESAILLGTSSFWEGVDVKGEALKLVLIDRIPFTPPDDPIVQARESALKEKGLNVFVHFQLPEAIIAMKQGAGRLIRDYEDYGVLMLCDPRLSQKSYGKTICNSLPPFSWCYDPQTAIAKLKSKQEVE